MIGLVNKDMEMGVKSCLLDGRIGNDKLNERRGVLGWGVRSLNPFINFIKSYYL